jgi:hypothetical protein
MNLDSHDEIEINLDDDSISPEAKVLIEKIAVSTLRLLRKGVKFEDIRRRHPNIGVYSDFALSVGKEIYDRELGGFLSLPQEQLTLSGLLYQLRAHDAPMDTRN